ncbi:MAG TPA: hypothetical protein VFM02_01460 [Candidatus Paceibacterota bacterium]|nr:hypothetical protein [Candidatus Paceibacterota bacterium]
MTTIECVVRISRHTATDSHVAALHSIFGNDINIVTKDIAYGDDPVGAVQEMLQQVKHLKQGIHAEVDIKAVEAVGPESIVMALVQKLEVPVIRPVFRRENGRVVIVGKDANGRDIFDVERYEWLEIENRPTLVGREF